MKRLFAIFLILIFSSAASIAAEKVGCKNQDIADNKISFYKRSAPIEDEFIKSDCFPKVMPTYIKNDAPIVDDFIESYEQDGATIKLWARKNAEYQKVTINDDFATSPGFISRFGKISVLKGIKKQKIEDNFIKNVPINQKHIVTTKNYYDFSKQAIPVKLKIIKNLSTKHKILEGDSILFKTIDDVIVNGNKLPKGTKIIGRVETISDSDKMGTPANIIVDNFYVENNPEICFYGNISKTGANRSIWVYPLYQAGNIILYAAGFVFVPIHGGHAKLLTNETYTVFYETK